MGYLVTAVVAVGLLCVLDLIVSIGVIRRLRQHTDHLNRLLPLSGAEVGIPPGQVVGEFTAATTDGQLVSRERLVERFLVGFFSPGCKPCAEQLPHFLERARSVPGGRRRVLAVVNGLPGERDTSYVERLGEHALVVTEQPGGPVQAAFQVTGFPTFYLVDGGGTVAATGHAISDLGDEATVAELAPA